MMKNYIIQMRGNFQAYIVNMFLNFWVDGWEREIDIYFGISSIPVTEWTLSHYLIQFLQQSPAPVRQELLSLMNWRLGNLSKTPQLIYKACGFTLYKISILIFILIPSLTQLCGRNRLFLLIEISNH